MGNILYIFLIISGFLPSGCQQKGLSDYSTPLATYKTYIEQAKALRVVADHRNYRRAIRCFTNEDRKWFEKNYNDIEFEKEEFYKNLYKSKKFAYVFGRTVVLSGPSPDEENYKIEKSSDSVQLRIKGYSKEIKFIKTNRGWQMVGLFGVKEKVSH